MFAVRSRSPVLRIEATKKTATTCLIAAREEPIRFTHGKVNRVMRIGAYSWGKPKKLPWKCSRAEFDPAKGLFPQRAGHSRPRPEVALPSFARCLITAGTFRGPETATRSFWASHPIKWSWSLTALPRFDPPSARRRVGEVSEQGRKRSGACREARRDVCAPRISGKRSYVFEIGAYFMVDQGRV